VYLRVQVSIYCSTSALLLGSFARWRRLNPWGIESYCVDKRSGHACARAAAFQRRSSQALPLVLATTAKHAAATKSNNQVCCTIKASERSKEAAQDGCAALFAASSSSTEPIFEQQSARTYCTVRVTTVLPVSAESKCSSSYKKKIIHGRCKRRATRSSSCCCCSAATTRATSFTCHSPATCDGPFSRSAESPNDGTHPNVLALRGRLQSPSPLASTEFCFGHD